MVQGFRDHPKILDEHLERGPAAFGIGCTQHRRRMDRRHHTLGQRAREYLPTVLHQPELRTEHRLRGRRAETDDDNGLDDADFGLEPRSARFDLG